MRNSGIGNPYRKDLQAKDNMTKVLIIDDDRGMCYTLSKMVRLEGHQATHVQTLKDGLMETLSGSYDLVLLDVMMPDGSGLEVLPKIKRAPSMPEVIIITAAGSSDGAGIAITSGAWDYLQKPFSYQELKLSLVRAFQYRRERMRKKPLVPALRLRSIIGRSPEMMECINLIAQAAATDANVLITGETGTGKELFARAIHESSPRSGRNFVVVDCGALPGNLVESILFGHEKGAFTGAERSKGGLVAQADGGTLFLDEVGELPLSIQKAFLRVLQERSFRPVGARDEVKSDFRLVAATNRNLGDLSKAEEFREDLLFRLRSIVMHLPPLRGRTGDILDLFMHYMRKICDRYGLGIKGFSPEFLEALLVYDWPGNIRELIHTMESAIASAQEEPTLYRIHLPPPIRVHLTQISMFPTVPARSQELSMDTAPRLEQTRLKEALEKFEREYLDRLLSDKGRDIKEACRISGLSRTRLYERLRRHGLQRKRMQDVKSEAQASNE